MNAVLRKVQLGMTMFLLSEAVLFLLLIAAFVYFHQANSFHVDAGHLDRVILTAVCLAAGAFSTWRAQSGGGIVWPGAAFLFAVLFAALQGARDLAVVHDAPAFVQSVEGHAWLAMESVYELHLLLGVVVLAIVVGLAAAGHQGEKRLAALRVAALYWYFVDAVWIVILAVVNLGTSS